MSAVLMADELPQDVTGAEAVLGNHVEHKGEIDARQDSFDAFRRTGEELIAATHYASNEVSPDASTIMHIHECHSNWIIWPQPYPWS